MDTKSGKQAKKRGASKRTVNSEDVKQDHTPTVVTASEELVTLVHDLLQEVEDRKDSDGLDGHDEVSYSSEEHVSSEGLVALEPPLTVDALSVEGALSERLSSSEGAVSESALEEASESALEKASESVLEEASESVLEEASESVLEEASESVLEEDAGDDEPVVRSDQVDEQLYQDTLAIFLDREGFLGGDEKPRHSKKKAKKMARKSAKEAKKMALKAAELLPETIMSEFQSMVDTLFPGAKLEQVACMRGISKKQRAKLLKAHRKTLKLQKKRIKKKK